LSRELQLTQGKVAIVDECDFERVSQFKWCAGYDKKWDRWYAARSLRLEKGKWSTERLHRFIMGLEYGDPTQVDHIAPGSESGLNNQKSNLRLASSAENQCNRGKTRNNTSTWKGVSFYKNKGKWGAQIRVGGKLLYGGTFLTAQEAAKRYDALARLHHGAYAVLNFPDVGDLVAAQHTH